MDILRDDIVEELDGLSDADFVATLAAAVSHRSRLQATIGEDLTSLLRVGETYDEVVAALATPQHALDAVERTGDPGEGGRSGRVWERARIEGEARRAILQAESVDAIGVAQILGRTGRNRRDAASSLRRDGRIVGLDVSGRTLFPLFQFEVRAGRVRPVVAEVNRLLDAKGDPWGVASWWLSPSSRDASRRSPADLAVAGSDDVVRAWVRELLAD